MKATRPRKKNPTTRTLTQRILYLQIAVMRTAHQVGGFSAANHRLRGLAVAVIYDTDLADYRIFIEGQVVDLVKVLRAADQVVGYNCLQFDYEVLRGCRQRFRLPKTLDLYREISKVAGVKVPLSNVVNATLGKRRLIDGNTMVELWNKHQLDKLIVACKRDVDAMRAIHEHGQKNGYVWHIDPCHGRRTVKTEGW